MKTRVTSFICIAITWNIISIGNIAAQDIHFSQYYNSPLTLNPALTGALGDIRANVNYKDQWRSVETSFKTVAASYDMKLFQKKWNNGFLGTGLSIFNDKAGDAAMGTNQANLSISANRLLNRENSFVVGLQGGFVQKSINYSNLIWDNQYNGSVYDPSLSSRENFSSSKFTYGDFAAGILWNYAAGEMYSRANDQMRINAGIAVSHLNQPGYSFYGNAKEKLRAKLTVHGSALIGIKNSSISIVPSFMYTSKEPVKEIMIGSMFRYTIKEDTRYTGFVKSSSISLGGHYRFADSFIIATQFDVSNYMIGLSYDVNLSGLKMATVGRGGFEVALRYISLSSRSKNTSHSNTRFL